MCIIHIVYLDMGYDFMTYEEYTRQWLKGIVYSAISLFLYSTTLYF